MPEKNRSNHSDTLELNVHHTTRPNDHEKDHDQRSRTLERPPYSLDKTRPFKARYKGSCFCDKVQFEIARDTPLDAKFCHCPTCQKLHGAPFQWAAIVEKKDVHFTEGENQLAFWNAEEKSQEYILPCKVSCNNCRTPIMDEGRNMLLVFPTLIHFHTIEDKRKFYPTCHIFYANRAFDVKDGLPKFEKHKGSSPQIPETVEDNLGKERD